MIRPKREAASLARMHARDCPFVRLHVSLAWVYREVATECRPSGVRSRDQRASFPLQRQLGFRASEILFLNMLLPVTVSGTRNSCGTRPWSAGGGCGELSHHALDNCYEGGTKPSPMGTVRFSRVVPSLLVSALHFRSAPWEFAGGCARFDPRFFPPPGGTPGV